MRVPLTVVYCLPWGIVVSLHFSSACYDFPFCFLFLISISFSFIPTFFLCPTFLSCLHWQIEKSRHELIGRFWYAILRQRNPLPMCHSELLKKDKESEDVLVPHIHCLLSPGLPYVAFLISSSLPNLGYRCFISTHTYTLSPFSLPSGTLKICLDW